MRILKIIIIILIVLVLISFSSIAVAIVILNNKTSSILDDFTSAYTNSKYNKPVLIDSIKEMKQDVSCGYAVIEMFAKWDGNNTITESTLFDKYGKVVTSTGKSFENEMNKQFKNYKTTMYKYFKNSELIDKVYDSLNKGIPVPIEWAAKYENEWTLHYSLVIGMDIPNDLITVSNPYGYIERTSIKEFLNRTSFESYENMPLFLKLGFAFGMFEKNTIFIVEKI